MAEYELDRIDVLKLHCEDSELSILGRCSNEVLAKIGFIVGECHGREAFRELVGRRFGGWNVRWLGQFAPMDSGCLGCDSELPQAF